MMVLTSDSSLCSDMAHDILPIVTVLEALLFPEGIPLHLLLLSACIFLTLSYLGIGTHPLVTSGKLENTFFRTTHVWKVFPPPYQNASLAGYKEVLDWR